MDFPQFPMRQVHLDFHNAPQIPDIGADWDADLFAKTLTDAGVNSITIFAKCHHGMNYYPTKIGPVHPSLKFDLLGAQIDACHKAGIRCPIYVSVGWEMSAAERHPEWCQKDINGQQVGRKPFEAHPFTWPWMCVNNAYTDELIAQTEELLEMYDCDGFFFDIMMYKDNGCVCANCLPEMIEMGLDPQSQVDRRKHNKMVLRRFMERMSRVIRAKSPNAGIFYNGPFDQNFEGEASYYSQVEIESLPTGEWGYGFYPHWSRYGRHFGMPHLGMTGRFHRSWADWGGMKHPDALRYEAGTILATGGAISVGDQLHPRGKLNRAVYQTIGTAFREFAHFEQYSRDATYPADVALLLLESEADRTLEGGRTGPALGASRMLLELHQQFDLITAACPDFGKYKVLVLPDQGTPTPDVAARLQAFVENGGKILASNTALLDKAAGNFVLADALGVDYQGDCASNPDYLQIADSSLETAVTPEGFSMTYYEGPSVRAAPRAQTRILADAYESYFNRNWEHFSSHAFTAPRSEKADYPAITESESAIYLHGKVFAAYHKHGNLAYRALVGQCLKRLLPQPLIETNAPSMTEVSLLRQANRDVVYVVNYQGTRRAPGHSEALETPVPLHDVSVRLQNANIARAFLARTGEELPVERDEQGSNVVVPRVEIYEAVVFEHGSK